MSAGRRLGRALGYTLMELMLVLTLVGVLMGLGMGAFLSLGKKTVYEQSLANIAGLINKVRNASSRFPAALVTDPAPPEGGFGRVYGRTEQILQELHFEPRKGETDAMDDFARGIGGLDVEVLGGELVPDGGHVGGGLRVQGGGIDCRNYAPYDVEDGLSFELWIKPERVGSATLVKKGEALTVSILPSRSGPGRIRVRMGMRAGDDREEVAHEAPMPALRENQWLGVTVGYDRNEITVRTDEGYGPVLRGAFPETRPLYPDSDAALMVAPDFLGVIDDFRFGGVTVEDPIRLPDGVWIAGPGRTIHFMDGKLDPRRHPGVEQIFVAARGERAVIEIGRGGTVQDLRRPKPGEWPTGDEPPDDGTENVDTPEKVE